MSKLHFQSQYAVKYAFNCIHSAPQPHSAALKNLFTNQIHWQSCSSFKPAPSPSLWNSLVSISLSSHLNVDHIQSNQELHNLGYISDIQHGKNFKDCLWKEISNTLKLGISLFVDWFNTPGNKISGKTESTGVLALSCLNLPPTIWNKVSHLCLAGITPGLFSHDPNTINHLLRPWVNKLISLEDGILIPTNIFPAGQVVQVKLLALLGDVLATKKVAGYASHLATKFCPFCHASHTNIPQLQLSMQHKKDSQMNRCPMVRIKSTGLLGPKWILQGHFCYRWRFWARSAHDTQKKRKGAMTGTHPKKRKRLMDGAFVTMEIVEDNLSSESNEENKQIEDIMLNGGLDGSFFSEDDFQPFREHMKHVFLPPGVPHLPLNLGAAKHGKLSASQWLALWVFLIPLVIPERKFKPGNLKKFKTHYKKYSDGVGEICEECKVLPNHHFSLHMPQQMEMWGPLLGVSEFAGEHLIGFLQKTKTNHKIDEMHISMMNCGCQLQHCIKKPQYAELAQRAETKESSKRILAKPIRLSNDQYQLLFWLVSKNDCTLVHWDVWPVPRGRKVVPRAARVVCLVVCNNIAVGPMSPCNCVVFKLGKKTWYGSCIDFKDYQHVSKTTGSYSNLAVPVLFLFGAVVGKVETSKEMCHPSDIVSLAAYFHLYKGIFSINEDGIILFPHARDVFLNITVQTE
ncbi:hypothetical protein VP01_2613g2 [Puccinia sorghi]|uniref:Uncharacterized protein n=1 Tax=Puccinia sorghi TaxID=27349 RepID=A0A0L6V4J8_9BASI|nr:hypothetical protein VP01_2613g2 [Puccinia sorghi]